MSRIQIPASSKTPTVAKPAKKNPVEAAKAKLAKDQKALAANQATQKTDDLAFKAAEAAVPAAKDLFVQAAKTLDKGFATQQKALNKKISADEFQVLRLTTTPKAMAKELSGAKKALANEESALKATRATLASDNKAIDALEKADPTHRAMYEAQRQAMDAPLKATISTEAAGVAADKKNVKTLAAELKALQKANGGQGFQGTGAWHRGPGTLGGEDTSHWTSEAGFRQSIRGKKWTAVESSNGTGGVDPTFASRWAELGKQIKDGKMKLRVAYHFMSPGNGVAQAQHFLNTVGVHGKLQPGTRLCLDWEGSALSDPGSLRDAANYIHKKTGVWPMVYVQGSALGAARATVPQAPIWEAAWSAADGSNGGSGNDNRNVPFFQYAGDVPSNGDRHDFDVFNGGLAALEKFAGWTA